MMNDPKWLKILARHMKWLAVPNIAILFVTLQALGFFFVMSDPVWVERLALIPAYVLRGEIWRVLTFLALPMSSSLVGMIFALWFLYFILNAVESEWGEFKTTLYTLVSILLTIAFSFAFNYPIAEVSNFSSTLFLAAATLYPNMEIRLYFMIPVKMKYLGYLALGFFALKFFQGDWLDRLYLLAIYSNYFLFFGPTLLFRIKEWKRRREYRSKFK